MSRKPVIVSDVEIQLSTRQTVSLSWHYSDARYHVWSHDGGETFEETLYKNPLLGVETTSPDWYWTRHLSRHASHNKRMFDAALAYANENDLFVKAADAKKQEDDEWNRLQREAAISAIKAKYADQMYDVLKKVADVFRDNYDEDAYQLLNEINEKIQALT